MDKVQQELIAGYVAKARSKLRVARELVNPHEWDDVVSRAYYAAFHAAQAVLLAEGHQAETYRGLLSSPQIQLWCLVKTCESSRNPWGKFFCKPVGRSRSRSL